MMVPVLVPVLVSLLVSQLRFVMAQDVSAAQSAFSSFMQNPTISSLNSKMDAQTDEGARSSVSQAINSLIQSFVATYSVPGGTAPSATASDTITESTGNSYISSPSGFSSDSTFVDSQATSVDSYSATLSSPSFSSPSNEPSSIAEISSTPSTNSILTLGPTPEGSSSSSLSLSSLSTLSPSSSTSPPIIIPLSSISSSASPSFYSSSPPSSSSSSTYNDASAKESQRSYFFSWLSSQLGPAGAQQTADPFGQDPLIIWMSQWYQTATDSGAKSSIAEQLSFISSLYAQGQSTIESATTAQSTTQNPYYSPTAPVARTAPVASLPTAISSGSNSSPSELSAFVSSPSSTTGSSTTGIFDNPTLQSLSRLFITATDTAVAASAASSINALFASLHDPNAGSPQANNSSQASVATTYGVSPSSESVATTFGASSSSHSAVYTFGQSSSDSAAYTFRSPSSNSVAYTFGEDSPTSTPGSRAATTHGINSSFASVATTFGLITDSLVRNVTTAGSHLGSNTTNTSTIQPRLSYGNNSSLNPIATSILDVPPWQSSTWFSPVAFQTTFNGVSSNGSSLVFNFPNGAGAASVHILAALMAVFTLFL